MRNATLFAFTPALIAIGFGVWAVSPANTPASPSLGQGIEPLQIMVNAKELPTVEQPDYTCVFADPALPSHVRCCLVDPKPAAPAGLALPPVVSSWRNAAMAASRVGS